MVKELVSQLSLIILKLDTETFSWNFKFPSSRPNTMQLFFFIGENVLHVDGHQRYGLIKFEIIHTRVFVQWTTSCIRAPDLYTN